MTYPALVQLTIIIATYNRAASLDRLLSSIQRAEGLALLSPQVLVVDNGSRDETHELLQKAGEQNSNYQLTVLSEANRGKASALNSGLKHVRGEYILVVDDDVVIDPWALVKHVECHQRSPYDAVQGRVLPGLDFWGGDADVCRLREYNIPVIDHGDAVCEIRGLTGTNMSFRREVIETVGGFDVRLGPGASGFSEDTEFSIRLRNAGFKIGYTPHAIAYHELDPGRYGRAYNRYVQYRKGLSRSIYRHDSIVFKVLPDLLANCCRYAVYRLFGMSRKAYKTEGRILKGWGYLAGKCDRAAARGRDAL